MKLLNCFWPFVHNTKAISHGLFLSCFAVGWLGSAFSVYANNDSHCHATYSISSEGQGSVHVPCVVLDSAIDGTMYQFELQQIPANEQFVFTIVSKTPTTDIVSSEKAIFNETTGAFALPIVAFRNAEGVTEYYAVQMLPSPTSNTRLIVSSITPLKEPNIAVCHIPSGNPAGAHTIYISMNTYENTHKAHGDTLGECDASSPDDTGNTDNGETGTDTDNAGSEGTGTDGTDNAGSEGTGTDGTDNAGSEGTGTDNTDNTGSEGTGTDNTDNTGSEGTGTDTDNTGGDDTGTDGTDNTGNEGTGTDNTDNTGNEGTGTDNTDNTGSDGTGTDGTDNTGSEGTGTEGTDNAGNDGTGGDGIVTAYSISGYAKDIGNKVNISLNTISSEISTSKTDNDGKYVFHLSEAEYQDVLDNGFAYIKVGNEALRGLILGLNKFTNSYSGSDTDISYYSEALFRIKDALGLDLNATKVLYKDFLQSYNNGIYELNDYSYSFVFRDIIEELAENIRENLSNNTPLISHDEIIGKIKLLNHLEVSDFHKATKYSFPLLSTENDTIVLTITSFKNHIATDDFTANMEVIVKNDSPFYDNAFLTKINFSDASVVLKDVNVKTFVVDINKQVLFNDEYKDTFKDGDNSQVVENNKIQLIFNNDTRLRKAAVEDGSTDIYYEGGRAYVKLVFDTTKLEENESYNSYINVEVYDDGGFKPDINTELRVLNKGVDKYFYDFTKLLNEDEFDSDSKDKHVPVKIALYDEKEWAVDPAIKLAKAYGFIDWNNDYQNSTIAKLTLKDTLRGSRNTTSYGDNVFDNSKGHETEHVDTTPTHRIIDFDKIVEKDILIGTTNGSWKKTEYAVKVKDVLQNNDDRKALLLIHGWQGGDGLTYPSKLLRYENSEFDYWHNFISYYLATPKVYNRYKLYTYHYPSYKHVTYNARMLKVLLEQKTDTSSVLGKGFKSDGIVIIGHSMGGLVARSFIEEHKALGNDAEKLTKLITLDTPHHGSPSSISNYWRTQMGDIFSKDFDTPGAVDLLWDNYDNKYSKDDGHFKATVTDISNGDSRIRRMHELDGYGGSFDKHYGDELIDELMNPYLKKLNKQNNYFSKDKYIIYTAVTLYGLAHKLKNPVDNDNIMLLNTKLLNDIGYAAGGAEPVCSSLFTVCSSLFGLKKEANHTDKEDKILSKKKFIIIENNGDTHNREIPYRIFWDYDHETIMNGQISKGDFDKYIDSPLTLSNQEIGKNTNFSDVMDGFDYGTARNAYIDFANDYLLSGKNDREVDENTNFVLASSANPLKQEPVFLVLQRDLLDADESPTSSSPLSWTGNASIISYHGKNANEDNYEYPYGITHDIVALHPKPNERPVGFFQWQVSKDSCDRLKIDTDILPFGEKNVDITFGDWSNRDSDLTFKNVTLPFIIGEDNTGYTFSDDDEWYVIGVAFRDSVSESAKLSAICTSESPTSSSYTTTNTAIILDGGHKWNGNGSIISGMFTPLANDERFGVFKDVTQVHPSSEKPVVFFQWMSSDICPTLTIDVMTTDEPPKPLDKSASARKVQLGIKKWNDESYQLTSVTLPDPPLRKKSIWNVIQVAFDNPVNQSVLVEASCPGY